MASRVRANRSPWPWPRVWIRIRNSARFSPVICWSSAPLRPPASSAWRTWSADSTRPRRIWSSVPPVKSTLYFGPPCARSHTAVAAAIEPERRYAKRRYRMNGRLVPIRSWSMERASSGSDAEPLDRAAGQHEVEDHSGEQHGGEHVGPQTDDQGDREPLHRPGAEAEQEERAQDRRHVGVENRAEGAVVAELDRLPHRLLVPQLLADALEDEHVGVHRHADREHQPGDAGQRERRADERHRGGDVQHVERQGGDRNRPRELVVDQHE